MLNTQTYELSATCSNNKFVTWKFATDNKGELHPTKKPDSAVRSNKSYYSSSFDRESLWAWEKNESNPKEILIDFHSKANRVVQYFYFLESLLKDSNAPVAEGERPKLANWAPTDLKRIADLIV